MLICRKSNEDYRRKVVFEEHISLLKKPGSQYIDHISMKSSDAKTIANWLFASFPKPSQIWTKSKLIFYLNFVWCLATHKPLKDVSNWWRIRNKLESCRIIPRKTTKPSYYLNFGVILIFFKTVFVWFYILFYFLILLIVQKSYKNFVA